MCNNLKKSFSNFNNIKFSSINSTFKNVAS